jgi:hypothetical protein
MTIAQRPPNREERRQRDHELAEALSAARHLQARLEMLGDRAVDVRIIRSLRNSLAEDMARNARQRLDEGEAVFDG